MFSYQCSSCVLLVLSVCVCHSHPVCRAMTNTDTTNTAMTALVLISKATTSKCQTTQLGSVARAPSRAGRKGADVTELMAPQPCHAVAYLQTACPALRLPQNLSARRVRFCTQLPYGARTATSGSTEFYDLLDMPSAQGWKRTVA